MLKEVESQLVNKLSALQPVETDGSIQAKCCMVGTKRLHASAGSMERTMKVNHHHLCRTQILEGFCNKWISHCSVLRQHFHGVLKTCISQHS